MARIARGREVAIVLGFNIPGGSSSDVRIAARKLIVVVVKNVVDCRKWRKFSRGIDQTSGSNPDYSSPNYEYCNEIKYN